MAPQRPKAKAAQCHELIRILYDKGAYCHEGQHAIKRLATIGEPAIDAMLHAFRHPPPSELHPRD
jgi:hypothetical protein